MPYADIIDVIWRKRQLIVGPKAYLLERVGRMYALPVYSIPDIISQMAWVKLMKPIRASALPLCKNRESRML